MKTKKTKLVPTFKEFTERKAPKPSGAGSDPKIAASLAEMRPELKSEVESLRKIFSASDRQEVMAHYKAATIVRRVIDDGTRYGVGAVKQLEATTGIKSKTLYRWAQVAGAWPKEENVKELLATKNKFGRPLTWSHLEALSEIEKEEERDALLSLVISRSLSVRHLKAMIAEHDEEEPEDTQAGDGEPTALASRSEIIQRLETVQAALRKAQEGLTAELKPVLAALAQLDTSRAIGATEEVDATLSGIHTQVHEMGKSVSEVGYAVQRVRYGLFRVVRLGGAASVKAPPAESDALRHGGNAMSVG